MYRLLESQKVQFAIDGALWGTFRRELLAVPIPSGGELALVRLHARANTATRRGATSGQQCNQKPSPLKAPVLLVHGFGMNRYTWHLNKRSFAGYLAHLGYDVFIGELRGVGRSRQLGTKLAQHLDEYIEIDLPKLVDATLERSGQAKTFVIGHSMGGLVTYCAMPDLAPRLCGVSTLSAIFTFSGGSAARRLLSGVAKQLHIPQKLALTPFTVRKIGQLLSDYVKFADSRASLALLPFQAWYPRGIERDLLLQQIRIGWDVSSLGILAALLRVGRHAELVSRSGRRYLDEMPDVDLPLLVVAAERDTLLPPIDARAAFDRSNSKDKQFVVLGPSFGHAPFGHLDLILGQYAPRQVWPIIGDWLDARAT